MSVLVEFAMFPTDKGESASPYVSRIIRMFAQSGVSYKLTPMGTVFETENMNEALSLIEESYKLLESDCNRIYSTVKFDIRKNMSDRMNQKIKSIESKIGKVNT
jgi:uncharacterized protein (TIGR00106 family)